MDPLHGLPTAPDWALRLGELGRGLTNVSIGLFLLAVVTAMLKRPKVASAFFVAGCVSILTVFSCLLTLFVTDQFSFEYVFGHSDKDISTSFKVAAIWTAQEGSFLLWAACSAIFGLLTIRGTGKYRSGYVAVYSGILGVLAAILAYESPFAIMKDVIRDGKTFLPPFGSGMVPSLQNYWVVIHPPVIFLGFGSLAILAAYAVAAMIAGDAEGWIAQVRPWALASLAILGLGVCMGGLWAYETQGWGGFWAWDPVENVSLVPWIFTAVFVHGVIVQGARKQWVGSNLLMAGLPFLLFVYGTFLTRSGLLDKVSVHSFASMDGTALAILRGAMIASTLAYIGLWAWKSPALARAVKVPTLEEAQLSREKFYRFGMLLLAMLATVISLGMSWPVITALRGGQGSRVEEWLYHLVVVWFFVPIMLLMGLAPFVGWKGLTTKELAIKMNVMIAAAIFCTGVTFIFVQGPGWGVHVTSGDTLNGPFGTRLPLLPMLALLMFACWFTAITASVRVYQLARKMQLSAGGFVAHLGLAVTLAGLILSRGLERKQQEIIQSGGSAQLLDYKVNFNKVYWKDEFDREGKVVFDVDGPGNEDFTATPGLYYYDQNGELKPQVWPFVKSYPTHDVYFSLHPPVTEVWEKPQPFKPGEIRTIDGITVTYVKPTREGTPGQAGAKFGGEFLIKSRDGQHRVSPYMELMAGGGPQTSFTPVGKDFLATIAGMDAATKTVQLSLLFQRPLYPLEVFTKPLTSLVWLGTGILFLGGMMSAVARRRRVQTTESVPQTENLTHAPLPASQG